jgi:crossover junction endodeoxyribonuclease RusA
MFPLEFYLSEIPLSLQAKPRSQDRWKSVVRNAARQRAEDTVELIWLEEQPLAVTIYYFPPAPMPGDIDNIVKPILDAMIGTAYPDDKSIERIVSQKFEPATDWSFDDPTEQLSAALDAISASEKPSPVVYIRIDNDLSWRRL